VPHQLTENFCVANPPGDQLGRLAAEIQHQNSFFLLRQICFAPVRGRRFGIRQCGHGHRLYFG
jgi:hypothetical protein